MVGGGVHEGVVLLYIPLFLRGGGFREIPSKDMGVAYSSEYCTFSVHVLKYTVNTLVIRTRSFILAFSQ